MTAAIFFSPTGNTRRCAEAMAMAIDPAAKLLDLLCMARRAMRNLQRRIS